MSRYMRANMMAERYKNFWREGRGADFAQEVEEGGSWE